MIPEPIWTPVGLVAEFADGHGRQVRIGARRIAVFREGGAWSALKDACPHRGSAFHGGVVRDGAILCPAHGWSIGLADGVVRGGDGRVASYPVRIVDGRVEVGV